MSKFVPSKIVIHHSLTKDTNTVTWGAIRKYHTETLGWQDIGYHAGCELTLSGRELYYEILLGRMWDVPGAHTKGHNNNSLGFCFIGNFDTTISNKDMLRKGAGLIALWVKLFKLSLDDIYPHSFFNTYKTCPGTLFDMAVLKTYVAKELSK